MPYLCHNPRVPSLTRSETQWLGRRGRGSRRSGSPVKRSQIMRTRDLMHGRAGRIWLAGGCNLRPPGVVPGRMGVRGRAGSFLRPHLQRLRRERRGFGGGCRQPAGGADPGRAERAVEPDRRPGPAHADRPRRMDGRDGGPPRPRSPGRTRGRPSQRQRAARRRPPRHHRPSRRRHGSRRSPRRRAAPAPGWATGPWAPRSWSSWPRSPRSWTPPSSPNWPATSWRSGPRTSPRIRRLLHPGERTGWPRIWAQELGIDQGSAADLVSALGDARTRFGTSERRTPTAR